MQAKHEWRKKERNIYFPGATPEIIDVPVFSFITIEGEGSPADSGFSERVRALYSMAYTIKMMLKKRHTPPARYSDYTVYPLEGVWDINEEEKKRFDGVVNKEDFVYKLMIRQPDFVDKALFEEILSVAESKKNPILKHVNFESLSEGLCVQMLHIGSFDSEPATFEIMENFAIDEGLVRLSKVHREVYLSDARKVTPDKLKTVLRFQVKHA